MTNDFNNTENDKKLLGAKPLDFYADITNIFEPIIIDNPTKQEEYLKKKVIEALNDVPKPKVGYLVRDFDDK